MADDTLFEGGGGEHRRDPDEIDIAVEQVFSRAVDRQLEEQRERNRLVERTTERLGSLEDGLRTLREQTSTGLTDLRAELQEHTERLGALDDLRRRLDEVDDGRRRSSADLQETLDQLGPGLAADLRRALLPIADDVADLHEQLLLVRGRSADGEDHLGALREDLTGTLAEGLAELRRALDAGVAELREALTSELSASREADRAHREALDATLDADREQREERVGAVLEAIETRLDDLARVLGRTLPEALAEQREELTRRVAGPLGDATERLQAAQTELRAVAAELGGLPGELGEQISSAMDRAAASARDEAREASSRLVRAIEPLDGVQARLEGLETSLVGYLEARDVRLEEERMRVLRDLVEEFAQGLSRRQRRKLARKLDDARERVASADRERPPAPTPAATGDEIGPAPTGLLAALLGEPEEPEVAPTGTAADEEPEPEVQGHPCPECGFVAKSAGGLASHRRTHT